MARSENNADTKQDDSLLQIVFFVVANLRCRFSIKNTIYKKIEIPCFE